MDRDTPKDPPKEPEFNDFEAYVLGFTAAVAVAPQPTPPSRWLMPLSDQFESRGKSDFKMLAVDLLELGEYQMEGLLAKDWQPVIATNRDPRNPKALPCAVWSQGFFNATNLEDLGWPHPDSLSDEVHDLVAPIMACSGFYADLVEEYRPAGKDPDALAELLAKSVVRLRELHLEPWIEGAQGRRGAPKADRNDPCPCGSGKPYKSCCSPLKLVH